MQRLTFNRLGGVGGGLFGAWSIYMASNATSTLGPVTHEQLGKVLIGFWALVPPVFLWTDWVGFRPADQNDKENAKHTHDLSRNIWLALVAVLTVLFNIKWTGG